MSQTNKCIALQPMLLGVGWSEVLGQRPDGRVNAALSRTIERNFDLEEAGLRDL